MARVKKKARLKRPATKTYRLSETGFYMLMRGRSAADQQAIQEIFDLFPEPRPRVGRPPLWAGVYGTELVTVIEAWKHDAAGIGKSDSEMVEYFQQIGRIPAGDVREVLSRYYAARKRNADHLDRARRHFPKLSALDE